MRAGPWDRPPNSRNNCKPSGLGTSYHLLPVWQRFRLRSAASSRSQEECHDANSKKPEDWPACSDCHCIRGGGIGARSNAFAAIHAHCRASSRCGRTSAQHPHPLGRRYRLLEHQHLQPGHDGLQDAEHRPHRQGRRDFHRLLRPAELHGRTRRLHHRTVAISHGVVEGRVARRQGRHAGRKIRRSPNCSSRMAT